MRRTKIIATLGPATQDPKVLEQLFDAGVDVVRLNFSHGNRDEYERTVATVRDVARRSGRYIGILGDLQGPKIRIERFRDGSIDLNEGQSFVLDSSLDPDAGTVDQVGVAYDRLNQDVGVGDTHGVAVVVDRSDRSSAEASGRDGEYAGTRADIENVSRYRAAAQQLEGRPGRWV